MSIVFRINIEKHQPVAMTPQDMGNNRIDNRPMIKGEVTFIFFHRIQTCLAEGFYCMQGWLEEALCANTLWKKEQKKGVIKQHLHLKSVNLCCYDVITGVTKSIRAVPRPYLQYDTHISVH